MWTRVPGPVCRRSATPNTTRRQSDPRKLRLFFGALLGLIRLRPEGARGTNGGMVAPSRAKTSWPCIFSSLSPLSDPAVPPGAPPHSMATKQD
jgi:hypothetical protein